MSDKQIQFDLKSEQDTAELARKLGRRLKTGDVVLLEGEIGAGKSFFARSLIQSVQQVVEDVPSPTFTLVQTYASTLGEIWHADLYRLGSADEVIELGLLEAFEHAICLVEWPEILGDFTPENALRLCFETAEKLGERQINLHWSNPAWNDRLTNIS